MRELTVYCAHHVSKMSADQVFNYYDNIYKTLEECYNVLIPMFGRSLLRAELEFGDEWHTDNPLTTNHAIFGRDRWMVEQADVIYANLLGTKTVSIVSMMELAWASMMNKHVVLVMEEKNVHRHAFVLEAADIVYDNVEDALDYLRELSGKKL